jgi:ribosomal protein S18 acetylase RimI-like enzyme
MITFQTLENISTDKILEVFNLSFSDYVIPFRLTKEQLEEKIISESIRLEFSVGAFENDQLIAFILHGLDIIDNKKVVYNGGTGVIPTKRGNRLTVKMYEYILPVLYKNNIDKVLLEVITTNEAAIKTYRNIGFEITRQLNCFKGSINITSAASKFEVRELETYDWEKLHNFWDLKPTWQNSVTAVEKIRKSNISVGVYENENLLGYTIYNPQIKRIHQLSVDKNNRKRGIGRRLLEYISTNHSKDISIINVDDRSDETLKFMNGVGMNVVIKQYEMELILN